MDLIISIESMLLDKASSVSILACQCLSNLVEILPFVHLYFTLDCASIFCLLM